MPLQTRYEPDNIFAKIIRGDLPCVKVHESANSMAIMDVFPQTKGHVLVMPKQAQATNLLDIDPADLSGLIADVQLVTKAVQNALGPDGIRIAQFNGAPAGQTVFHLHFHILPVFEGVDMKPHAGEKADDGELENLAAKIRGAL